jgi:hypothetical protein
LPQCDTEFRRLGFIANVGVVFSAFGKDDGVATVASIGEFVGVKNKAVRVF